MDNKSRWSDSVAALAAIEFVRQAIREKDVDMLRSYYEDLNNLVLPMVAEEG